MNEELWGFIMKNAYKTYKDTSTNEAKALLAGDGIKKAVIYQDGPDYKMAFSVFTQENKGLMRHFISSDTVSSLCEDITYGEQLFDQVRQMKQNGDLFYRIGSLENPVFYGRLGPNNVEDKSFGFPLFRNNEKYRAGMDLNHYVNRSRGIIQSLSDSVCKKYSSEFRRAGKDGWSVSSRSDLDILYTLDRNADGSFPDLAKPAPAPQSQYDIDRISDVFGIEPENGFYRKGVSFTPILACDRLPAGNLSLFLGGRVSKDSAKRDGAVFLSSPYCFNLRNSTGDVKHDIVIDPMKAMTIVDVSLMLKPRSKQTIARGVFTGGLTEYERKPYPPLKDDTYLYSEADVEGLYSNASGVSSVFRDPCFDFSSNRLSMRDIEAKPSASKGMLRAIYVPDPHLNSSSYRESFSDKAHNYYVSLLTKCGYLEKNGVVQNGWVTDARSAAAGAIDVEPEIQDEIEF